MDTVCLLNKSVNPQLVIFNKIVIKINAIAHTGIYQIILCFTIPNANIEEDLILNNQNSNK
jgi:hypothetical protein